MKWAERKRRDVTERRERREEEERTLRENYERLKAMKSGLGPGTGKPRSQIPTYQYRDKDTKPSSLNTVEQHTFSKPTQQYTGTAMLGIATMHKSNSVPIFSQKDAEDVTKMRRN